MFIIFTGIVLADEQQPDIYYEDEEVKKQDPLLANIPSHRNERNRTLFLKHHFHKTKNIETLPSFYYFIIALCFVFALVLMCRFVRQRRVVIRYNYR